MSGFLTDYTGGQKSSMRLNMLLMTIVCSIILLSIAAYIIISGIKGNEITQWSGMGVFCLGVAGIVTGVSYTKAMQKKTELNGKKEQPD